MTAPSSDQTAAAVRAIVCGGRDYSDWEHVVRTLDAIGVTELAHGCASGADSLAKAWAYLRRIPTAQYPANWANGKAAGPIRNQRMLDDFKPDAVIAFPGGRGTADMVRRAQAAGVKIITVEGNDV